MACIKDLCHAAFHSAADSLQIDGDSRFLGLIRASGLPIGGGVSVPAEKYSRIKQPHCFPSVQSARYAIALREASCANNPN
ncbi:MAG TPA: hypothetical protein VJ572_06450, partial [Azonexus sp.]|nr:hypothetical protein [Azonexus sp.]